MAKANTLIGSLLEDNGAGEGERGRLKKSQCQGGSSKELAAAKVRSWAVTGRASGQRVRRPRAQSSSGSLRMTRDVAQKWLALLLVWVLGATTSPVKLTFTKNILPLVGNTLLPRGWDDCMQPHDSLDPFEQTLIDFLLRCNLIIVKGTKMQLRTQLNFSRACLPPSSRCSPFPDPRAGPSCSSLLTPALM